MDMPQKWISTMHVKESILLSFLFYNTICITRLSRNLSDYTNDMSPHASIIYLKK